MGAGERLTPPCLLALSWTPPEVEELWIGLNDLKQQMNFEWSDGSFVSFTHWHPFEPNNFRDSLEDCVTIWGPVRAPIPDPHPSQSPSPSPPVTPTHSLQGAPTPRDRGRGASESDSLCHGFLVYAGGTHGASLRRSWESGS